MIADRAQEPCASERRDCPVGRTRWTRTDDQNLSVPCYLLVTAHRFGRALKSPWRTSPKVLWLEALRQRSIDGWRFKKLESVSDELGFRWPKEKEKRLMLLPIAPGVRVREG